MVVIVDLDWKVGWDLKRFEQLVHVEGLLNSLRDHTTVFWFLMSHAVAPLHRCALMVELDLQSLWLEGLWLALQGS